MKRSSLIPVLLILAFIGAGCGSELSKSDTGVESISAEELKLHLEFLAADEFMGRDTPSPELKIASKYIAGLADSYGLKTMMPDNSFYQGIPLLTYEVDILKTNIVLNLPGANKDFKYPGDFGLSDRDVNPASLRGDIVFAGLGFQSPDGEWDDLKDLDVGGKIVMILDPSLPESHPMQKDEYRMVMRYRAQKLNEMGAKTVLKVISLERENSFTDKETEFDNAIRSSMISGNETSIEKPKSEFNNLEIRHDMAASILGISNADLIEMIETLKDGKNIKGFALPGKSLAVNIVVNEGHAITRNVVAMIEGSDPSKKDEFVVFGAHYDHIGTRDGEVLNGANDNGSGSVALLEMAKTMAKEKTDRSLIFVWFTGEEKGLWGAEYFVANPPVPIEKISACINLDVVSGDELGQITIIGSKHLSSELDGLVNSVNEAHYNIYMDYMDDNPRMAGFFLTHSDHFPFMKYGIPSVWLGSESDPQEHIHQPSDMTENINYEKIELVTRFTYLLGRGVANHETLMPLDVNPEIKERGAQNKDYDWEANL